MPRMSQSDYLIYLSRRKHGKEVSLIGLENINVLKSEADLHQSILDVCRVRGWIAFHGSMAQATHRTVGEPDFIILASDGRVLLIECKSTTGKLTSEQLGMQAWAEKLGHKIHVIRSMEEFFKL